MPKKKDKLGDLDVEELTLEDLEAKEKEGEGEDRRERPRERGGLRAGGLGPEGSRYAPPVGPRRQTWKPKAAGALLIVSAIMGIIIITSYITAESFAEDETFDIYGRLLDLDKAEADNTVPLAGVQVTVKGVDDPVVTDEKGYFQVEGIPGGRFEIHFFKRDWVESINTTIVSLIIRDEGSVDEPITFYVVTKETGVSVPTPTEEPRLEVEVLDWPSDDTVQLRVHTSSFWSDLSWFRVKVSQQNGTSITTNEHAYTNVINFTFTGPTPDYSRLWVMVENPEGMTDEEKRYVDWTEVELPAHPLGPGGWEETSFPDVALFVRGGPHAAGGTRTVVVHSNDGVNYSYQLDGSNRTFGGNLTDGGAELVLPLDLEEGSHRLNVTVQNETGEVGGATTFLYVDTTAPDLAPIPSKGGAVTSWGVFDPGADDNVSEVFLRYQLLDGSWSPWQLDTDEVVVPIIEEGTITSVSFQARDEAGNVATQDGTITIKESEVDLLDQYARNQESLRFCLPIMILGIILAIVGGYMAWNRKRPTLAMVGCIGALLASAFYLVSLVLAFIAIILIMLSREEFETPGPPPQKVEETEDEEEEEEAEE